MSAAKTGVGREDWVFRVKIMKLNEIILADAILPDLRSATRDALLREMVQALADAGAIDPGLVDEIVERVIKREKTGSTGFGKGVAVPHAKHKQVTKMVGALGRSVSGVDFSALDNQPVYSVVLLLSPEHQPELHLQAMNIVFTNLQQDMFRRFLRQTDTREKIIDLLEEADGGR